MKKFFACLSMLCLMAAPVSFTSCDDDDVSTVLNLLDYFLNTNDLAGTAWLANDNSMAIEFTDSRSGVLVYADEDGEAQELSFSYTLSENVLTLTFSDSSTIVFTITGYEQGSQLQLTDSKNNSMVFNYYTGE